MLVLRVVVANGGLTFIASGVGVHLRDTGQSATWGSRGRKHAGNFTATCHATVVNGGMGQRIAGVITVAAGLIIVLVVMLPSLLLRLTERSRQRDRSLSNAGFGNESLARLERRPAGSHCRTT